MLTYVKRLFFISFFEGDISNWFILYIMLCYLLTPVVYRRTNSKRIIGMTGLFTIALFGYCFYTGNHNVLFYRLPIFFLALILIGQMNNNRMKLSLAGLGLFTLLVYTSLILFVHYPYKYFLYMIAAIPCLIFVAMMLDKIDNKNLNLILSFIGGISLELYLIHTKTLFFSDMISTNVIFRIIFSFTIAIALSYILHLCLAKLFATKKALVNNLQTK